VATKTPSKGKKATAGDKVKSAPKKARAQKPAAVEAREPEPTEPADADEDDDLDDEDEEAAPRPAAAAAPAKKPAAKPSSRGGQTGEDAPQVVPARRLTPEAKAKINELVAKGMPLGEALRAAASWETFVAPVREEPAKLVQGRSFDGGGRPAGPRPDKSERAERDDDDSDDEEPNSPGGGSDDE
jgi:hypothetical protein